MKKLFSCDTPYTRGQIRDLLGGGSAQSYLPTRNGKVLCGCFDPKKNRRAPFFIDIGAGPQVKKSAQWLVDDKNIIPVFIKQASHNWRYQGEFRAAGLSYDSQYRQWEGVREIAIAVLFLEQVKGIELSDNAEIEFPGQMEGNKKLRLHYVRERKPGLAKFKKELLLKKDGCLRCEVCGLNSRDLPEEIGLACFEVHHRVPLASLEDKSFTTLEDLAILCANCHRMIHKTEPLMSVEEFGSFFWGKH
ncbi:MAG: HNH endonuclease [Calditrichaeota bacterium]|nr:HNH endonuclease [Calditrichota bacterium]